MSSSEGRRCESLLHDPEHAAPALAAHRAPDGRSDGGLAAGDRDGRGGPVRLGQAVAPGTTRPRAGSGGRASDHCGTIANRTGGRARPPWRSARRTAGQSGRESASAAVAGTAGLDRHTRLFVTSAIATGDTPATRGAGAQTNRSLQLSSLLLAGCWPSPVKLAQRGGSVKLNTAQSLRVAWMGEDVARCDMARTRPEAMRAWSVEALAIKGGEIVALGTRADPRAGDRVVQGRAAAVRPARGLSGHPRSEPVEGRAD